MKNFKINGHGDLCAFWQMRCCEILIFIKLINSISYPHKEGTIPTEYKRAVFGHRVVSESNQSQQGNLDFIIILISFAFYAILF